MVRGSPDDGAFTVFYLHGGRLAGALTVGRSEDLGHARRLIASGADARRTAPTSLATASSNLEEL